MKVYIIVQEANVAAIPVGIGQFIIQSERRMSVMFTHPGVHTIQSTDTFPIAH